MELNLVCKKVTLLEELSAPHCVMNIELTNGEELIEAIMFGILSDTLEFIDKDVLVSFREEVYKNKIMKSINNMTILNKVNVLDRDKNIKLYVDDLPDTGSNINFQDIEMNATVMNAIVYCNKRIAESSSKSTWVRLQVMDKKRHISNIRIFDTDDKTAKVEGKYLKMDLRKNKFGFITQEVFLVESIELPGNPELSIAKKFIQEVVADDGALVTFLNSTHLLDVLEKNMQGEEAEVGYELVRLAMCLSQARELKNISPICDIKLIMRTLVARKAYALTDSDDAVTSREFQNFINISRHEIRRDKRMSVIFDSNPKVNLLEKDLVIKIEDIANTLVSARKNLTHVLANDKIFK